MGFEAVIALFLAAFFVGFAWGRRAGRRQGFREGYAFAPIEFRRKRYIEGICPVCRGVDRYSDLMLE